MKKDSNDCPIARAISRAIGSHEVCVEVPGVYDIDNGCWEQIGSLPKEACLFASHFDSGDPVEPFEFEFYGG